MALKMNDCGWGLEMGDQVTGCWWYSEMEQEVTGYGQGSEMRQSVNAFSAARQQVICFGKECEPGQEAGG